MSREGEEREHRGQKPAQAFLRERTRWLGAAQRMLGEGLDAPAPEAPDREPLLVLELRKPGGRVL